MRLRYLKVQNYRGLRDIEFPLSQFVCLIGENNSGKSSILQALKLFHSGTSLAPKDFFDPSKEIRIELELTEITEDDLQQLANEHRSKIRDILQEGNLSLVRVYSTNGKSKLLYRARIPKDPRFAQDNLDDLVKKQRPGQNFVERVTHEFPELKGKVTAAMNQAQMLQAIQELINEMPDEELTEEDRLLPTGIDKSIYAILPEPIYIPAVKDLSDDVKTKEGSHFGRIMRVLLDQIQDELQETAAIFDKLNRKLNPIELEDGTVDQTNRLQQLIDIEAMVQRFVQESFRDVKLKIRIPPPEIRTVLAGAQILADDGVEGPIDTKGDGLRRAVVFAILRAYASIRRQHATESNALEERRNRYLLLFEEPELFLHPTAQLILFDALREFFKHHPVVVSTHSPLFLDPEGTGTFIKLFKVTDETISIKPFTRLIPIDLSEISAKDQFQLICYENNNAAFFANTVVLVEGDSDLLVLPHIARIINPEWDASRSGVYFAKINGKSSIRRYRQFFKRFGVRTPVITDLDLLVNDFDQIDPTEDLKEARARLLEKVDRIIEEQRCDSEDDNALPTKAQVKEMRKSAKPRILCKNLIEALKAAKDGTGTIEAAESAYAEFYEYIQKDDRLSVLEEETDPEFIAEKRKLLALLREQDVYVLERGAIEAYYPENIEGHDKPTKAQCFCNTVTTKDEILQLCAEHDGFTHNGCSKEFCLIFGRIFEPTFKRTE